MSMEVFLRAAAGVMGAARDGFGAGGGSDELDDFASAPETAGGADEAGSPTGSAGTAHGEATAELHAHQASLADLDSSAAAHHSTALSGSRAGRSRMDSIIAGTAGDVEALASSITTPQGRSAMVSAVESRLQETRMTLAEAVGVAVAQKAAIDKLTASYEALAAGPPPETPTSQ